MEYIEAIGDYSNAPRPWVFIGGGISDCPNWQQELCRSLENCDIPGTVLNPRRGNFPIHDPNAAREQITWEFHALNRADIFSMWFCNGPSLQPICLYELGRHLAKASEDFRMGSSPRLVCLGVEPGYLREQDVRIQTELALTCDSLPWFEIANSLSEHRRNIIHAVNVLRGLSSDVFPRTRGRDDQEDC